VATSGTGDTVRDDSERRVYRFQQIVQQNEVRQGLAGGEVMKPMAVGIENAGDRSGASRETAPSLFDIQASVSPSVKTKTEDDLKTSRTLSRNCADRTSNS